MQPNIIPPNIDAIPYALSKEVLPQITQRRSAKKTPTKYISLLVFIKTSEFMT